jgi:16S rRNA (adenine1518-N6/adenine1519-N6)-dimethyltransferase
LAESIQPKKSLGQHFLIDQSYCRRILSLAQIRAEDLVLEIGSGTGLLTNHLLDSGAQVVAVEFDRDLIHKLEKLKAQKGRLDILPVNVLNLDRDQIPGSAGDDLKVVGNLPYNIATRIIRRMTEWDQKFHSLTVMVQKEVAMRVLAKPGESDYSAFSVLMDYYFERKPGFDVPPGAFKPPPKVRSHVLQLIPRSTLPDVPDQLAFSTLLWNAFRHRRKTLANNLKSVGAGSSEHILDCLSKSGVGHNVRAQELSLDQFVCLARML